MLIECARWPPGVLSSSCIVFLLAWLPARPAPASANEQYGGTGRVDRSRSIAQVVSGPYRWLIKTSIECTEFVIGDIYY